MAERGENVPRLCGRWAGSRGGEPGRGHPGLQLRRGSQVPTARPHGPRPSSASLKGDPGRSLPPCVSVGVSRVLVSYSLRGQYQPSLSASCPWRLPGSQGLPTCRAWGGGDFTDRRIFVWVAVCSEKHTSNLDPRAHLLLPGIRPGTVNRLQHRPREGIHR